MRITVVLVENSIFYKNLFGFVSVKLGVNLIKKTDVRRFNYNLGLFWGCLFQNRPRGYVGILQFRNIINFRHRKIWEIRILVETAKIEFINFFINPVHIRLNVKRVQFLSKKLVVN